MSDFDNVKRVVVAGRVGGDFKLDPSFLPEVGDTVRFRYTPNDLKLVSLTTTREGSIAVVHQYSEDGLPKGGFACHARDLRVVKRGGVDASLTTD